MAKCVECVVPIREGEHFCGACGTQQPEVVQASESVADLPSGDADSGNSRERCGGKAKQTNWRVDQGRGGR